MAAFENFLAVLVGAFPKEFAQGRHSVMLVVKRITEKEESAFFRGEKEDEPHHYSKSAVVEGFLTYSCQQCAVGLGVDAVEGLHEHFHGTPDLVAELIGDFLLVFAAFGVERGERVGFCHPEKAAEMEQALEGAQGDRLLHPKV